MLLPHKNYSEVKYNLLHEWAGNIEWNIVTDYLDINIAIFREKDQSLYWYNFDNNEIKYDPNKRLILILNKYCIKYLAKTLQIKDNSL